MPCLNLDLDYFDHPKTVRLVALCGPAAEVCPIKLWAHAGKFFPESGLLKGYSPAEVEAFAKWTGEPGQLVAAMTKVGYIHKTADGYQLHEWLDHEGHLHAFKERARKASAARWDSIKDASSNPKKGAKQSAKESPLPTMPSVPTEPKEKKPSAANGAAAKPIKLEKRKEATTPFWQELIVHMNTTWAVKKKSPLHWQGKFYRILQGLCRTYQTPGVMALWDLYLESTDDFVRNAGYSVTVFETVIPRLVDNPAWKTRAKAHEDKLYGGPPPDLSAVLKKMVPDQSAIKRSA